MGFGVSGASAIIFLGLLIGGVTLYAAVEATAEQLDEAHDMNQERLLDRANTEILITVATYNETDSELSLTADNTGTTTLSLSDTTLLVDNEYRSLENASVEGDAQTDLWPPGTTMTVTLDASDPKRVKVVSGLGVSRASAVEYNQTGG
jgi:flagellar protein FlaF